MVLLSLGPSLGSVDDSVERMVLQERAQPGGYALGSLFESQVCGQNMTFHFQGLGSHGSKCQKNPDEGAL